MPVDLDIWKKQKNLGFFHPSILVLDEQDKHNKRLGKQLGKNVLVESQQKQPGRSELSLAAQADGTSQALKLLNVALETCPSCDTETHKFNSRNYLN